MAMNKAEYLLLEELKYDMARLTQKALGEKDLRVIANSYRDMADLADHFAEKIEDLDR